MKDKGFLKYLFGQCQGNKGQALVELIIVIPILVMLFYAIIDMGRLCNTYLILENASREGAILASNINVTNNANLTQVTANVENFILTANAGTGTASGLIPNYSVSWNNRLVPNNPNDPTAIRFVTVTVTSDFDFQYLDLIPFLPDPLPMTAATTMPVVF